MTPVEGTHRGLLVRVFVIWALTAHGRDVTVVNDR